MSLTDLIERVEGATGPDRYIDRAIWYAIVQDNPPAGEKDPTNAALYTASLDAALALCERVLPGCVWTVMTDYELPGRARLYEAGEFAPTVQQQADGATPALALILAMLKALQAKEGGGVRSLQKQARKLRDRAIAIRLNDYYKSGGVGRSAAIAAMKAQALDDQADALTGDPTP